MSRRMRAVAGYTLVEVLAVCMLLGVVMTGVVAVMVGGSHAELDLNKRFSAQNSARTALTVFRNDAHLACAALVNGAKTQVTLSVPTVNRSTSPATAPDPTTQCGAASSPNIQKVIWCTQPSPSNVNRFALYRTTTGTCSTSGKFVADNLVNTAQGFAGFFNSSSTIPNGQLATVTVDLPVSLKSGTTGALYDLTQTIAMRNAVWVPAAGSCTAAAPCVLGLCTQAAGCLQPTIN